MGVGCCIWYSEEGPGRAAASQSPLLAAPNVLPAHPSTASVPITVLQYDGLLLCGFNVVIKGLTEINQRHNCGPKVWATIKVSNFLLTCLQ